MALEMAIAFGGVATSAILIWSSMRMEDKEGTLTKSAFMIIGLLFLVFGFLGLASYLSLTSNAAFAKVDKLVYAASIVIVILTVWYAATQIYKSAKAIKVGELKPNERT